MNQQLSQLQAQLGQPRLRTPKAVLRRAKACLQTSKVGQLMSLRVWINSNGQVQLAWQVPEDPALAQLLALVATALAELLQALAVSRQPLLAASTDPTRALIETRRG